MDIEELYREIAPKLASYLTGNGLSHATTCDVVQETFLRLWKMRDRISDDPHEVSGLAFTIARNYRNDLCRKNGRMVSCEDNQVFETSEGAAAPLGDMRPGEESEESDAIRRRLKATLGRMPVRLLETFALSRLGNLTVKDIASGTGASEANVKVRVHRAKELFREMLASGPVSAEVRPAAGDGAADAFGGALLKAMMMLSAVDGEISKEELSLYRTFAEKFRDESADAFERLWVESVKAMAYVGFLSEMLAPEDLVGVYVEEVADFAAAILAQPEKRQKTLVLLERLAAADGDYSRIERACIAALARRV